MNAGKLESHSSIEYALELDATAHTDTDCTAQANATLTQRIATSPTSATDLFTITAFYTKDNGGITRTVTVAIPALDYAQSFSGESRARIVLENYTLHLVYNPNTVTAYYLARADALRIYTGNTLRATFTNLTTINDYIAPAGVPFLAPTTVNLTSSATATFMPLSPCANPNSGITATASINATAKARYLVDGAPYPMRVDMLEPPAARCGNTNPELPTLSANDTGNIEITAHAHETMSQTIGGIQDCIDPCLCPDYDPLTFVQVEDIVNSTSRSASLTITPEVTHAWVPLADDTRALVREYARPSASATALTSSFYLHTDCSNTLDNCIQSETATAERVPETPAQLRTLHHESLPRAHTTAPYHASVTNIYARYLSPNRCRQVGCRILGCFADIWCGDCETVYRTTTRTSRYPELSNPAGVLPYLNHTENLLRYWNLVYHPHWSRFLYFTNWATGYPLAPVDKHEYWRPLRVQYLDHPDLPEPQRTRRRAHIMLEPCADADTAFIDWLEENYTGDRTWWLGVPRFLTVTPAPPATRQTTQADAARWTFTGATPAFTPTGIQLDPTGTTTVARFKLAHLTTAPGLYPALADAVRIEVSGDNIVEIRVELENAEGERNALAEQPSGSGWYPYSQGNDGFYQGTWAMETRAGEKGTDLHADGRSLAMQADGMRRVFMQLFAARAARELVITITQSEPAPLTLAYPRFRWEQPRRTVAYPLTGNTAVALHLNGGYHYLPVDLYTESVREPHQKPSVADYLALERVLYAGEPRDENAIKARAETLYDPIELPRPVLIDALRSDTRAVPHALRERDAGETRFMLINALAAIPPLAMIPKRPLLPHTLEPDPLSDLGCYTYHLTPNTRSYVAVRDAPVTLIERTDTGDTTRTSALPAFGIWRLAAASFPLNNDETLDNPDTRYLIVHGTRELARVTPFWGFWLAHTGESETGVCTALAVSAVQARLYWHAPDTLHAAALPTLTAQTRVACPAGRCTALEVYDATHPPTVYIALITGDPPNETARFIRLVDGYPPQELFTMNGHMMLILCWHERRRIYTWCARENAPVRVRYSDNYGISWQSEDATLDGSPMTPHTICDVTLDARHHALYLAFRPTASTVAIARSTDGIHWETVTL